MNKKHRREVVELSLVDNSKNETQIKDRPHKIFLRIVVISILFALIIAGYVFKFSINLYPSFFSYKYIGTFSASNYFDASDCDLIVIKPYKEKTEIKMGDIVCYSTNIERGSGKVLSYKNSIVEIENKNGQTKKISETLIVGKQYKTIAILGCIVEFIFSYYGIITFTLLLMVYVAYLTFSRINYENTKHGKILYKKYRAIQKRERNTKKLFKTLKGEVNKDIQNILENDYEQNLINFSNFNGSIKLNTYEKYKYILSCVHDAYLTKEELTKEDLKHISSIVELMCVSNKFDTDMEYMLIDLILRSGLVSFEMETFVLSALKFISASEDIESLLHFGSVLYVLVYKNKRINKKSIELIITRYKEKAVELDKEATSVCVGVANSIKKLIKK